MLGVFSCMMETICSTNELVCYNLRKCNQEFPISNFYLLKDLKIV